MTIQKSCLLLALCAALAMPASTVCEEPIELIIPKQEVRSPAIPGAPSPTPQAQETPAPASAQGVMQTAKEANLRKLPTIKSDLLERVAKGARVEVLSTSEVGGEVWANVRIRRSGREGYMLMTDAPSKPGLMTMLNVDKRLCSGQKMFCSAWIGNLNNDARTYPS